MIMYPMESIEAKTPKYMVYCVLVSCITSLSFGWVIGSPNVPGEITHNCATGNAHIYSSRFPDCLPMTTFLWAFAVASFCLGGCLGSISCGFFQTRIGRKRTIILSNLGFIVGSVLIGVSVVPGMFIAGRIICGLSCGVCSLVVPTYIGEISTIRARGAMGCYHQFSVALGIFLSTLIGMFLSYVPVWRINYALAGLPALIQTLLMMTCVESPRWLISVNRIDKAHYALRKLRASYPIDREFFEMVQGQLGDAAASSAMTYVGEEQPTDIKTTQPRRPSSAQATLVEQPSSKEKQVQDDGEEEEEEGNDERQRLQRDDEKRGEFSDEEEGGDVAADEEMMAPERQQQQQQQQQQQGEQQGLPEDRRRPAQQQLSTRQVFRDPVMCRMTMTLILLHVFQQFVGINAILYYSSMVFATVYFSDTRMALGMSTVDTAVFLVATVAAVALMDRMGRRPLLLISEAGLTLFAVVIFLGLFFRVAAVAVVGILLFVAMFALGMNPIPWLLTVETCPTFAATTIGSLTTSVNWIVNFIVALFFPVVFAAIQGYIFLIFAGIGLVSLVFTFFYIPETKNRSIEAIVREYEKHRR